MKAERTSASRKYGTALIFILSGSLLGVWHNRRVDSGKQDIVSGAVRTTVAPPASAINGVSRWLGDKTRWITEGRSSQDENVKLKARIAELEEENARLKESDIKYSPMANLMLSVMGAFAEFERALLRERQREGIVLARQRGIYRGRKRALSADQITEIRNRVGAGETKTHVAREFGICRDTLYQYLHDARLSVQSEP